MNEKKKHQFLIQMIEGYKVTFTLLDEDGYCIPVIRSEAEDFLKKYDPLRIDDYFDSDVTLDQFKELHIESIKAESEIRELFELPSDCPILAFDDGEHCDLIRREIREKLKNENKMAWQDAIRKAKKEEN